MKRSGFLPLFFTVLIVLFGIAVWIRLSTFAREPLAKGSSAQAATPRGAVPKEEPVTESLDMPVDTGTIVPVEPRSTRQERYKELLRTPPPAPPVAPNAPPPKERSMFDRIVTPIANALGGSRAKSANVAPQAQERPRPQQQPASQSQGDASSAASRSAEDPKPREEQDPETDVQPPHLSHAEFVPAQVEDAGETLLSATVTDNLSGVRSVSGVIASPSGALQGFSCRREGETDRFVASIRIPKDAAEGVWNVKYMTLSDNANNSVNLNQGAGALAASFRVVSSTSDSTPPQLRAVYLERRSMNAGEKNTVFVQAEDDKSGVSLVSGVFVSPSKQARIGFGCRAGSGGAWECTVAPPACLDCGAWQLEQIQVQDKANNMATFRGDNPLVQQVALDISGDQCDSGPPQIVSLALDRSVVSNAEGGVIQISAIVQDDSCGVASLSGLAVPSAGAGGQRIPFSFDPSPDGSNFTGRIIVPRHAARGTWVISWIQALDKGHNLRAYNSSEPALSRVTFTVE